MAADSTRKHWFINVRWKGGHKPGGRKPCTIDETSDGIFAAKRLCADYRLQYGVEVKEVYPWPTAIPEEDKT